MTTPPDFEDHPPPLDPTAPRAGMSPTLGKFAAAFARAQLKFSSVSKGREVKVEMKKGGEYSYRYAQLEDIDAVIRPLIAAEEICITQQPDWDGKRVVLVTQLTHSSGEWIRGVFPVLVTGNDPQSYGSAVTYVRRYSLCALCNITVANEDDDGSRASGRQVQQAPQGAPREEARAITEVATDPAWEALVATVKNAKSSAVVAAAVEEAKKQFDAEDFAIFRENALRIYNELADKEEAEGKAA